MMDRMIRPSADLLPAPLLVAINRAGYYPELVADIVRTAVGGDRVIAHLVHQETTFDENAVRRHITVLAMTSRLLVIAHADDHTDDFGGEREDLATATTETVPLRAVRGVMLTHVVAQPREYVPGSLGREITVTIGWGSVVRVDLLPATCGDPSCDADHGFEGTLTGDDIALRISAEADGDEAVAAAVEFVQALSAAIGQP